jgi:hypothetical protein
MIKILRIIIALALLTTISYFGLMTYEHSKNYEAITTQIASSCDANSLASERIDELTAIISLGLVKNKSKEILQKLKKNQTKSKSMSKKYLYYFMGTLLLTLLFTFTCTLRAGAMILSFATFISLIYGLINPILMVTIHKQVDYLGDVILSFESKGIIGSITKLFESGEFAVAFTILLFSILLPAIKSLTLTFMLIFYDHPWNQSMVTFFKQIGKWSMIDVFVVATFLVYFTSNTGGISQAEIQVGLYFFLAYVILSMITAIQTQKVLTTKLKGSAPLLLK